MTGTLDSLFAWLDAEVGVAEVNHQNVVILRDGTNLWRDYFGYQPPASQAAWCALFQSVADWLNGTPIPPIQFSKGFVGVDTGREWFRQHGLLVSIPQPGYLAFYNEHVGRVRRVTGPSTFDAIEGNEGDAVRLVHRSLNDIVGGFGVRTYSAQPTPPQPVVTVPIHILEDEMITVPPDGKRHDYPITSWAKTIKPLSVGTRAKVAIGDGKNDWTVLGKDRDKDDRAFWGNNLSFAASVADDRHQVVEVIVDGPEELSFTYDIA